MKLSTPYRISSKALTSTISVRMAPQRGSPDEVASLRALLRFWLRRPQHPLLLPRGQVRSHFRGLMIRDAFSVFTLPFSPIGSVSEYVRQREDSPFFV